MPKSVFTGAHLLLVEALRQARRRANLTQAELAARIGKDQSYVSLIEGAQRRVDVIEFCAIARALEENPVRLLEEIVERLPDKLDI